MLITQKCQYALRAIYMLARYHGQGPVKIADIAEAQAIPVRFLEAILTQLKQGKFIESRRGNEGGYILLHQPSALTVGEIMRFVQGPIGPVECITEQPQPKCPLYGSCVFYSFWEEVQNALSGIYDHTTFADLLERERQRQEEYTPSYAI